jgi:hypothetical protein
MKMYREPLNYSVWQINPDNGNRLDLVGYFKTPGYARDFVDNANGYYAVVNVDEQDVLYCPSMDIDKEG